MQENPSDTTKKLSILIARDGLSFCSSLGGQNVKHFYHKDFSGPQSPARLLEEIQSFFTSPFDNSPTSGQINILYAHPLFALVPRAYFDNAHLGDYLKFNTELLATDELTYDSLEQEAANLVYIPFTNINNYIFEQFGEFTYEHSVSYFVDQGKAFTQSKKGDYAFVNAYSSHFDLCIFTDGKLLLCNSYDWFAPEDLVYYVLFAFNQLNIDMERINLKLSGHIAKDSPVFDLLYTYVRHVSFFSPGPTPTIEAEDLKKEDLHRHQLLLNTL